MTTKPALQTIYITIFLLFAILFTTCKIDAGAGQPAGEPLLPGQIDSVEFGHRQAPATDYCAPLAFDAGVENGILISFWTRITYPIVPPDYRGNQNICRISGDNWELICLDGNLSANSDGSARYNGNFMLGYNNGQWGGDVCTYYSSQAEGITMNEANGWVWVAWQVVAGTGNSMTLRQWLKFGMEGTVFPAGYWSDSDGEETLAYGSDALDPICPAIPADWNPGPPRSIQIGDDNTYSGSGYDTVLPLTPSNSWVCHARLYARTDRPTIAELDAIARLSTADTNAWGDWELNWVNGAANLTDRSGNGHHLSVMSGGILTQGGRSPAF